MTLSRCRRASPARARRAAPATSDRPDAQAEARAAARCRRAPIVSAAPSSTNALTERPGPQVEQVEDVRREHEHARPRAGSAPSSGCVDALQASARPSVPAAFSAPVVKPPRSTAAPCPRQPRDGAGVRVVGEAEHARRRSTRNSPATPSASARRRARASSASGTSATTAAAGIRSPSGHGMLGARGSSSRTCPFSLRNASSEGADGERRQGREDERQRMHRGNLASAGDGPRGPAGRRADPARCNESAARGTVTCETERQRSTRGHDTRHRPKVVKSDEQWRERARRRTPTPSCATPRPSRRSPARTSTRSPPACTAAAAAAPSCSARTRSSTPAPAGRASPTRWSPTRSS